MSESIGIIDYGMGNLHSLAKAVERVSDNQRVLVSYDAEELLRCDKLILPGVGGAKGCMAELQRLELDQLVIEASRNKPMMGVCLGMQIMLEHSQENGGIATLGLFGGDVVPFPPPTAENPLKVPHMGWNRVKQSHAHPIWQGIDDNAWFYFVHSFHAQPQLSGHSLGYSHYGFEFTSAIGRDNLVAFQFHPEKSQVTGLKLLANFAQWDGEAP